MVMLTDEALAELAKIENKIGDYICRLCCQKFENAFSLALHRCSKIVHVIHRCPECAKVFNCPANLASHRRWHKPRSSLEGEGAIIKENIGKEEGEIFDVDDFIGIEEGETSSISGQTMVNSPISTGSISPSPQPSPQSQSQKHFRPPPLPALSQSSLPTRLARSPPPPPPPLLKRTKTICVTGTVKLDTQEASSSSSIPMPDLSTVNSFLPIPLIYKSPNKIPSIKLPIKSPIRSPYKPSPMCSLSPPPSKIPRSSHDSSSPCFTSKYPFIATSPNLLSNGKSIKTIIESDLPLALTSPTTPASPTSPTSASLPSSASSSTSTTALSSPQGSKSPASKSLSIMETIGSSSSSSSSSPSPPPPTPPSSTHHPINIPTTPPPTPPPPLQHQQSSPTSSSTTMIGELTTSMVKEPLFGWTYYPKKFRRQAYMRIKHCCP